MNKKRDLSNFDGFVRKKESNKIKSKEVLVYTRVSSKNQAENNNSLINQRKSIEDFCTNKGYIIQGYFGGTYESAKGDFTRTEFRKLIDYVSKQRTKPFGIVVWMINRFSRSGTKSIGILHDLVDTHKVHLIESSTELDTSTPMGLNEISRKLLESNKDNLLKTEIIIPGMVTHLLNGNRFGQAPVGYDHYGPRVKNGKFLHPVQKIVINETGRLIKEAFKLKLIDKKSDVQILNELRPRGLNISTKRLSTIWRNPFYCGVSTNSLLPNGKPVEGNWEKIISQNDFLKIQRILEGNHTGYKHKKIEEYKPLNLFLKCDYCDGKMVGYKNQRKKLSYYRCQKCKRSSLNMITTPKSLSTGAHDLFSEFLKNFEVNPEFIPLLKTQLEKIYSYYNESEMDRVKDISSNLNTLHEKLKNLIYMYGVQEINKEVFEITKPQLESKISELTIQYNKISPTISNLKSFIDISLNKLQNISKIWGSIGVEDKRLLQTTLFPSGISYNKEKHQYLTKEINSFVLLSNTISKDYEVKKKGINQVEPEISPSVARTRFELVTSGL